MINLHKNQVQTLKKLSRSPLVGKSGIFGGFLLATLITGTNCYLAGKWYNNMVAKQNQIIERIERGETATIEDVQNLQNPIQAKQLEGKKVSVTGSIIPGRFIVKRNRGNEQGYVIMAPYNVDSIIRSTVPGAKKYLINYMVNLGWVPKQNKDRIRETSASDVLSPNDLPDHLADEEDPPITSTFSAYIRVGQQSDLIFGKRNNVNQHIYEVIDLDLFSNLFGNANKNSRYVYLDRSFEEGEDESFPFAKTAEQLKQDYENNKADHLKKRNMLCWSVGMLSYAAAFMTI